MSMSTYDSAVIGAGIIGAATAAALTDAGHHVLVLDAGEAAGGATGNSFSWLNAVAKEPDAYHHLNALGVREYASIAARCGREFRHTGGAIACAAEPDEIAALHARVARLHDRGYAARIIDRAEVQRLEPALRLPDSVVAAFYEQDAWVDAPAVTRALLDHVRTRGGHVRSGAPVTGFLTGEHRVTVVEAGGEWHTVGAVVICAGTGTPVVAAMLGVTIPVERRPGLLAVTTPVRKGTLARVVYAPGVHLRPDIGGRLRIGADDTDASIAAEEGPGPAWCGAVLLRRAAALLGLPDTVAIARLRIGVRPVPADGVTIAGRLPGWDNAFVAVTHSGVTLGPLLGRLLAEEVVEGRPPQVLAPFRPDQFATATHR